MSVKKAIIIVAVVTALAVGGIVAFAAGVAMAGEGDKRVCIYQSGSWITVPDGEACPLIGVGGESATGTCSPVEGLD